MHDHRGIADKGQHEAILYRALFDKAHAILATQRRLRRTGEQMTAPSLLVGRLVGGEGRRFRHAHAATRAALSLLCRAIERSGEAVPVPGREA